MTYTITSGFDNEVESQHTFQSDYAARKFVRENWPDTTDDELDVLFTDGTLGWPAGFSSEFIHLVVSE